MGPAFWAPRLLVSPWPGPIGNEDVAVFLLSHGASFCSYVLLDSPGPSKRLLRKYFIEPSGLPSNCPGKVVSAGGQRAS